MPARRRSRARASGVRYDRAAGRQLHAAPELRHGRRAGRRTAARSSPSPTWRRLFERATGQEPFKIPDCWVRVRDTLDMQTRFDLSSNNDIVGGNSGSPMIDVSGHVVGLIFDGNIHSIAGDFWFDPQMNRAVAVDPQIMFEALRKVYKANELLASWAPSKLSRRTRGPVNRWSGVRARQGGVPRRARRCGNSRASHPAPAVRRAAR